MINCAHFNYNWHLTYNYADDVAPLVPAGTLLHIISWQDNTTANKNNRIQKLGRQRAADDRRDGVCLDGVVRPDR